MKKVWAVMFIIGVVMISLCGCGSESEVDDEESAKIQEEQSKEADTRYQREKRYHEDGREILVYTVFEYGPMQKSLVNSFNAENEDYYIEVQNMQEGNENDPMKAYEDFDLTLVNGMAGDILQVNSLYYTKYIRQGAYEDLKPYMEADEDFDRADYWENVFLACETDGKLFYVPASFDVQAYVGKSSIWEGHENMTAEEAVELFNNLPEGVELLFRMTRKDYVSNIMNTSIDNFVDWESGECNFESEQFKNVLRVAKNLLDEYISDGKQVSMEVKYGNGEVLLAELSAMDYRELQVIKMCMQEEPVVVNYPGATQKGNVLLFLDGHTYAINSDSLGKDGAWEFIKFALSKEQQIAMDEGSFASGIWMVPMNKGAFQKQMEKWQTPIWELNEHNEKIEHPIKCFISEDIVLDIYHATDEDVAFWTDIIENITTVKENNYVLTNIIMEEAGPYFSGQKSVDEVAKIIQGRISIYVNENKE